MSSDPFRRGALVTLISQWGKYGVQVLALLLLTRLLSPDDYGLVAMAAAVVGLAAVIGDFGLSLAALQAPHLSNAQKSNLFWINGLIGLVVGGVVASAAGLLAIFYSEPRLVELTLALSVVFAINGFSVQFRVEINRKLQFGKLALVDFLAQLVGLAAAVGMALSGYGYWALVGQQVFASFSVLALAIAFARWIPGLPSRHSRIGDIVRFGRDTFAVQVGNYVTTNLDSVLIGRQYGSESLGLYNRAFQLVMLPIQQVVSPLTRVFLPKLATIVDDIAFNATLGKLQLVLAYVMLAPLSVLAATSGPLLSVVFGDQWVGAGDLVKILALGGVFQSLGYIYYWAFLSRSRTKLLFYSELVGRIPMIVLMFALVGFGVEWVALAVSIGQFLIWLAASAYFGRLIRVRALPLLMSALRPCLLFGLAVGVCLFAENTFLSGLSEAWILVSQLVLWVAVVGAMLVCVRPYRADMHGVIAVVKSR